MTKQRCRMEFGFTQFVDRAARGFGVPGASPPLAIKRYPLRHMTLS
jgi:hypothetical protein